MFKQESDHKWCPLIKKDCVEKKCAWYMHIRGMDPNTGKDVDHWGCAVSWMPMLLIENSQQQRSTGSAVESFRNEMVKANETNIEILSSTANMYYDILQSQGVHIEMIDDKSDDKNILDNSNQNILPNQTEENEQ